MHPALPLPIFLVLIFTSVFSEEEKNLQETVLTEELQKAVSCDSMLEITLTFSFSFSGMI